MIDQLSIKRAEGLHPSVVKESHDILAKCDAALTGRASVRFTHCFRTLEEQADIYAQGRTKKGKKVSDAKPGYSYHNYGLAIDICLLLDRDGDGKYEEASFDTLLDSDADKIPDWLEVVAIFESFGWEWGGRWNKKDMPHFQKVPKGVKNVGQLLTRQLNKDFIKGTKFVRL